MIFTTLHSVEEVRKAGLPYSVARIMPREIIAAFKNEDDAVAYCNLLNNPEPELEEVFEENMEFQTKSQPEFVDAIEVFNKKPIEEQFPIVKDLMIVEEKMRQENVKKKFNLNF